MGTTNDSQTFAPRKTQFFRKNASQFGDFEKLFIQKFASFFFERAIVLPDVDEHLSEFHGDVQNVKIIGIR